MYMYKEPQQNKSSDRRGTGFAGPLAVPPARGEAATRSESATGVNKKC